jgi:hypothetical protein
MTIEAEVITPHLHGACVTQDKRIHLLFVANSSRPGQVSNLTLGFLIPETYHIGKRVSDALLRGRR